MSLAEKLKSKKLEFKPKTVGGELFHLRGLTRRARADLQAKCRGVNSGKLDTDRLEAELLTACVFDPETNEPVFADSGEWDGVPAMITGPLIGELLTLNGFDEDDAGKGQESTAET